MNEFLTAPRSTSPDLRGFGFRWKCCLTLALLLTSCGGDGSSSEDAGTGGYTAATGGAWTGAGGAASGGVTGVTGGSGGGFATGGGFGSGGFATGGGFAAGGTSTGGSSTTEPQVQVFLLFGQSNMWGVPPAEAQDKTVNPNVEVMALTACGGQTKDEWYPAAPPLHGCIGTGNGNPGLGPGDYFAKTIAAAYPEDTILLVPNAIPGVSIDVFAKGKPDYASIVSRAQKAQQRGTIRGMIFHQGESDSGSNTWVSRVKAVVTNLRTDLGTGPVPFLAGELPYTGCCGTGHNPVIAQLPAAIENAHVVSAQGLGILGDNLHFDTAAQREFGKRYGELMLTLLDP